MADKINIPDDYISRIKKYVQEGRFKDVNDFLNQAIHLLLYAEDNKEKFMQAITVIPKGAEQTELKEGSKNEQQGL
ncbi:MAG: hypothetical protein AABX75_01030 [Nanoarchaeota archaeon]